MPKNKNIVLLSDGTGNSAAKPFKTNVWRLYQAIDINPPKSNNEPTQIVFYDDGVGTENFKPLAYLGLALGIGLARNIKDLYTFLCRNYKDGDNIFLFGFSRGAFTVRMLAGLVLRCGLVQADNEIELQERVEHAYDEYKLDVARRATATGRALVLGWLLGGSKKAYALDHLKFGFEQKFPEIAFIGVWDTVDAYGMPVDELKLGIDKFIWPMALADRKISKHITRACHALSLDDDRPTFRPVLWDETGVDPKKLTQIWFGGVHANIGGGYPDDGLAHVTLQWIMAEAKAQGLWFNDHARIVINSAANPHGAQYDARSGIAGYYRYGPRIVDKLCKDTDHGVVVKEPKVHIAAMQRIADWQTAYAPVSFPSDYVLMRPVGSPPAMMEFPKPESDNDVKARMEDMELAWDAVARRRSAYFVTVILTLLLVVLPLGPYVAAAFERFVQWCSGIIPAAVADGIAAIVTAAGWPFHKAWEVAAWIGGLLESIPVVSEVIHRLSAFTVAIIGAVKGLLWSWTKLWFDWYEQHPIFFLIVALLLAWLFVSKSVSLQNEVFARADYAWRRLGGAPPRLPPGGPPPQPAPVPDKPDRTVSDRIVRFLRKNKVAQALYRLFALKIVPFLFAVVAFVVGLCLIPFFIPKFIRQFLRKQRYRTTGSPTDNTPAPRIPRSPTNIQPEGLAKALPEAPGLAEAIAKTEQSSGAVVRETVPA